MQLVLRFLAKQKVNVEFIVEVDARIEVMSTLKVLAKGLFFALTLSIALAGCGKKDEAPATIAGGGGGGGAPGVAATGVVNGAQVRCVPVNPDGSATFVVASTQPVYMGLTGWQGPGPATVVAAIASGGQHYQRVVPGVSSIDLFVARQNQSTGGYYSYSEATFTASVRLEPQAVQNLIEFDANGNRVNQVCIDGINFDTIGLGSDGSFYGGSVQIYNHIIGVGLI